MGRSSPQALHLVPPMDGPSSPDRTHASATEATTTPTHSHCHIPPTPPLTPLAPLIPPSLPPPPSQFPTTRLPSPPLHPPLPPPPAPPSLPFHPSPSSPQRKAQPTRLRCWRGAKMQSEPSSPLSSTFSTPHVNAAPRLCSWASRAPPTFLTGRLLRLPPPCPGVTSARSIRICPRSMR